MSYWELIEKVLNHLARNIPDKVQRRTKIMKKNWIELDSEEAIGEPGCIT
jgi:hypothetical protein